jgi:hypothetical protein
MPTSLPPNLMEDHAKNALSTKSEGRDEEKAIELAERQADGLDGPNILGMLSEILPDDETISRPSTMQMIIAPPPLSYYRRKYLRAIKCEYLHVPERREPPEPPQSLFQPGGIVYLDGQWRQLSSNKTSCLSDRTDSRLYPNADFEIAMGWKSDKDAKISKPNRMAKIPRAKEIHNPFSLPDGPQEKLTAYERLLAMEGLNRTKEEFFKIKTHIGETSKREGQLRRQDLNLVLLGNPGTGKMSS